MRSTGPPKTRVDTISLGLTGTSSIHLAKFYVFPFDFWGPVFRFGGVLGLLGFFSLFLAYDGDQRVSWSDDCLC